MKLLASLVGIGLLLLAGVASSAASDPAVLARGRYLARVGDCQACHTQPGHPAFAGGRAIPTPFGVFYTPNITPDPVTGLGNWTADEFYRAMHDGIGRNGEYLYPAFPFPAYTKLRREDVDAIWAYLRSIEPVQRADRPHQLRWPYSMRSSLGVWRSLFFTAGAYTANDERSPVWNRGAYLVTGLAHCGACHTPRNRFGALIRSRSLAGGTVPVEDWQAPNITQNTTVGIGHWSDQALRDYLATGHSSKGDALGPMRDVVQSSLQHLKEADLDAVITYLRSVPAQGPEQPASPPQQASSSGEVPGEALYRKHCASCHGDEGRAKHQFYPDLRGNSVVESRDPTNLILIVLRGGFQASTEANPFPYSMPPFGFHLHDDQIALIANYIRHSWGNWAPTVWPPQVRALR